MSYNSANTNFNININIQQSIPPYIIHEPDDFIINLGFNNYGRINNHNYDDNNQSNENIFYSRNRNNRNRNENNNENNNTNNRIIQQALSRSLQEHKKYKIVISKEALATLLPTLYGNLNQDVKINNPFCCISQDEFKEDDLIIQLCCNHVFNKDAILHWLTNENHICPVCRYEYDGTEIKNVEDIVLEEEIIPDLVSDTYNNDNENYYNDYENDFNTNFSVFELLEQIRYDMLNTNTNQAI